MWMSVDVWLPIAVGIAILLGLVHFSRRTGARRLDVGSVSHRWIAEHRIRSDESPEAWHIATPTTTLQAAARKGLGNVNGKIKQKNAA
jgi:hypothetical protein